MDVKVINDGRFWINGVVVGAIENNFLFMLFYSRLTCFAMNTFALCLSGEDAAQRQALPARAGFGGQSRQTPNPPMEPESRKCGRMPALVRCTRC